MHPSSRSSLGSFISKLVFSLLLLNLGISGCASPRTAQEVAKNRAAVLGTWEYRTDNISALQEGTFQIMVKNGRLRGRFRDSWRGNLDAQVSIHGRYMELALDRVRLTGRLEQNRFTAAVRSGIWDVSSSGNRRSTGYFVARRVQSNSIFDGMADFGCASLLREDSYTCSAFDDAGK